MTGDRWRELADGQTVDAPLSEEERAFLAGFAGDEDVRGERALFQGIEGLGEAEPLREDDRARAAETMARFQAERSKSGRFAIVGIAGVLAVAAAATLFLFVAPPTEDLEPTTVAEARVSQGTFMLADKQLVDGEAVPGGEWVRAKARACVDVDSGRACFDQGAELRILDGVVQLRSGLMEVEEGSVSLMDDQGLHELDQGDSQKVAAELAKAEVVKPTPKAEAPPEEEVDTGGPVARKARPKPKHDKNAGEMLSEARKLANKGKLGAAVSAYGALRRAYPGSAEARAANVSVGQLSLRRGKARDALKSFDRYLKRGGALAEEARWGRVQALHRMGKKGARDKAIAKLLKKHPHTVYAGKAKAMMR